VHQHGRGRGWWLYLTDTPVRDHGEERFHTTSRSAQLTHIMPVTMDPIETSPGVAIARHPFSSISLATLSSSGVFGRVIHRDIEFIISEQQCYGATYGPRGASDQSNPFRLRLG
jgi:hypothetical protein